MIGVVIGRCAAAGTSLASAVLGIAVLAPRTGRIAVIAVLRCEVPASAARCTAAMLTGGIVAPASVTQTVIRVVIGRISAITAIAFAPVLRCRIFFP